MLAVAATFLVLFLALIIGEGFLDDLALLMISNPCEPSLWNNLVVIPRPAIPFIVLVNLGLPSLAAARVGRSLRRRGWVPVEVRLPRWAVLVIVGGYLLTAVFGVPAVQTHLDNWVIDQYKRVKASDSDLVWEVHPYLATYASAPVAPGLVLTYHEYQLHGLWGSGEYDLHLWYGAGVVRVLRFPVWVS